MADIDVITKVQTSVALPQAVSDVTTNYTRGGKYREQMVISAIPKMHVLADEGSYFVATNPTPGTGLATIAALTALADTSPFILIKNNDNIGTAGKRIYLDYVKLICTAAGTAGTSLNFAVKMDGPNVTRYTSGGTQITPANANMDSGRTSSAQVYAGALVAAAASSSARLLGHGMIRTAIPVVNDTYLINFGGHENGLGLAPAAFTTVVNTSFGHAPVVIGPQQTFLLHLWLPAQSAASSYEVEIGYFER